MTTEQQAFINKVAPLAQKEMLEAGYLASMTIAQAIIESAWGTSELAKNANNFFGIKWNATCGFPSYSKETKEFVNGAYITVVALFRKYPDMETCVKDHSTFLNRDRYANLKGVTDYKLACQLIREDGYATSPTYTTTLISAIEANNLTQYDKVVKMPKVYLSPSSQEKNVYKTGNTVEEKVCNWIVDALIPILNKYHVETRRNNPDRAPADHVADSNAWGADWHIPIHTNAGGGQGTECFCYNAADPTRKGTIMANSIYKYVAALTPSVDRGVKTNQSFYEIIHSNAPCAYLEVEYHDSIEGSQWILGHIQQIAEAIAHGILDVLGIPMIQEVNYTVKSVTPIYPSPAIGTPVGSIVGTTLYTIVEEKDGFGRLKSGAGWLDLKTVSK